MTTTRRDFLRLAALGSLGFSGIGELALAAASPATRRLLVLVELRGGNDSLNTVVPFGDPLYARLRPRLAIARDRLVDLDTHVGLHPSLAPLGDIWFAGELAVVQSVGYPDPNLSHFRSIEIWNTASASAEYLDAGWLGRAFARFPSPARYAADGVVVGNGGMGPLAGGGRSIALNEPQQFVKNARLARESAAPRNAALARILQVERDVVVAAERLDGEATVAGQFPTHPFGRASHVAARLAANDAGIAVVRLSLDGFDTHANQAGVHANLLRQLAEGIAALRAALVDMGRWQSTVVATYSEFGRRPRENQSGGTDHGTAASHFVLGGAVKGGLYGAHPALDRLDANGNLPFAVDFRAYYATFLERWWGMDARAVLGREFAPLELLPKLV
jgi:uncharacterized protein (DUF1501 family)